MGRRILVRNIVNFVMTILLLVIMDYRFIGNAFHEFCGIILALLFIYHNILNCHWYNVSLRKNQTTPQIIVTLINFFLLVAMMTTMITGLLISQKVMPLFFTLQSGIWFLDLHQTSGYVSFLLAAIHSGFHWKVIVGKLVYGLRLKNDSKAWTIGSRIFSIIIMIYGIYASFTNHLGAKIMMEPTFGVGGIEPSLGNFLFDYLMIFGGYVAGTHYLMLLMQKK